MAAQPEWKEVALPETKRLVGKIDAINELRKDLQVVKVMWLR